MADPEELAFFLKTRINNLAGLFYRCQGYEVTTGYDFSASDHMAELRCWNQAVIAYTFINNDHDLLEYQVEC
jgi:hypothetical protein